MTYLINDDTSFIDCSHPGHLHSPLSNKGCPDFSSTLSLKLLFPITRRLLSSSLRLNKTEFNKFVYVSLLLLFKTHKLSKLVWIWWLRSDDNDDDDTAGGDVGVAATVIK